MTEKEIFLNALKRIWKSENYEKVQVKESYDNIYLNDYKGKLAFTFEFDENGNLIHLEQYDND